MAEYTLIMPQSLFIDLCQIEQITKFLNRKMSVKREILEWGGVVSPSPL